jgi:four helix bundle protein
MAKGDDIEARLSALSSHVLDISDLVPRTPKGSHIAGQLMRCGTAGGANYAEARAAESREGYIHKLAIVLKEFNETRYWLPVILDKKLIDPALVLPVIKECVTLSKIVQ